jgi:hypothetical protein
MRHNERTRPAGQRYRSITRFVGSPVGQRPRRQLLPLVGAAVFTTVIAFSPWSSAEVTPKRGGTLEFASTVEPGNYDCHGNTLPRAICVDIGRRTRWSLRVRTSGATARAANEGRS